MRHIKNKQAAFTIIETSVYLAVFLMISMAISAMLLRLYRGISFANSYVGATHDMRKILEMSVNNIREASFADNGAYPVESMLPNEFIFYSDIDNDKKIERVRLFAEGGVFKRAVIKSSGMPPEYKQSDEVVEPIAWTLKNTQRGIPLFKYLDASATQINDLSKVLDLRSVKIRVIVDADENRAPGYYDFSSSASLRNIVNVYDKW